jgi:hypothetical protein
MKFMVNGRRYPDGAPIAPPIEQEELARRLLGALEPNVDALREQARTTAGLTTYRGELEREPTVDLGDPKSAGWTVLVAQDDPQADDRVAAVAELAKHRGVEQPAPLVFDGSDLLDWSNWLDVNYTNLPRPPHYIAILGGPDKVPFLFQAFLDTGAAVGRLDFDSLDDLAGYAEKVVRLEDRANDPVTVDSAAFFAPDEGPTDPTHFSRRFMVEPLIEQAREEAGFTAEALLGDEATKSALAAALTTTKSALVYTASHGMVDFEGPLERRKAINGAICCQQVGSESLDDVLFTADDVPPSSEPFLEGAVFFQFACYGAGTPAMSDFAHWDLPEIPPVNASEDFVASLPKRLLAHPHGPVAFVGHVDVALLHGFDDPEAPEIIERWHSRLAPFRRAVERLLGRQPVGYAMADLNDRYSRTSAQLANTFDRLQKQTLKLTPEVHARLADAFLVRNDAQNYIVLGDPGASVRVESA